MDNIERHATNLVNVVYGNEKLQYDDPSENWFEATKIYRPSMGWDAPGVSTLLKSRMLQQIATRASKRYDDLTLIELPEPLTTDMSLEDIIFKRNSIPNFSGGSVPLEKLSTILQHSYGVIQRPEGKRRPIPSGGALYPLDIYILVNNVEGLEHGKYHYDPYRNGLVKLGDFDEIEFGKILLQEEAVAGFSFAIIISASFWRSRFKYGGRSYRFVFLEAGHLAQSLITLATAHGVDSRPYGGFIDDELMEVLGIHNGVDDAPIYSIVAGNSSY